MSNSAREHQREAVVGKAGRPASVEEKERFSSGGKRHLLVLRGKWGLKVDNFLLWLTGYSLMTKQYAVAMGTPYQSSLLLQTIGAKSGQLRRSGLPYFTVDDYWVVRGSNGGGATDPGWVHNIREHGVAWVRIKRKWIPVTARVAAGEEREELFRRLCKLSWSTKTYQAMCAPRELPLVILERYEA